MHRRHYLVTSGIVLSGGVLESTAAAEGTGEVNGEDDDPIACAGVVAAGRDDQTDGAGPEPIEFDGEGADVTDTFDLDGGVTIVEGRHDGDSNLIVELVGDDRDHLVFNAIGEFEGASGDRYDDGEYRLDVDADGDWSLTIRQPRFDESDADSLPQSLECDGSTWAGPYQFDGVAEAEAIHDGESNFIVEILVQDERFPELLFNEIGEVAGRTTFRSTGVGYVVTEADGSWTLELE